MTEQQSISFTEPLATDRRTPWRVVDGQQPNGKTRSPGLSPSQRCGSCSAEHHRPTTPGRAPANAKPRHQPQNPFQRSQEAACSASDLPAAQSAAPVLPQSRQLPAPLTSAPPTTARWMGPLDAPRPANWAPTSRRQPSPRQRQSGISPARHGGTPGKSDRSRAAPHSSATPAPADFAGTDASAATSARPASRAASTPSAGCTRHAKPSSAAPASSRGGGAAAPAPSAPSPCESKLGRAGRASGSRTPAAKAAGPASGKLRHGSRPPCLGLFRNR